MISIDLPRHWQLPVWVMAALSVGRHGRSGPMGGDLAAPVDVRIVGPQGLAAIAAGADPDADEVLACSCDAFGLPVPGGVPAGVIDIGVEVRAHPDQFSPEPDAGRVPRLCWWRGCQSPGRESTRTPGTRSRAPGSGSTRTPRRPVLLHAVAVEPLLVRGSVVIGTGLDAEQAARIRAAEAVTGRAGQ